VGEKVRRCAHLGAQVANGGQQWSRRRSKPQDVLPRNGGGLMAGNDEGIVRGYCDDAIFITPIVAHCGARTASWRGR
jgi:hypothetical protein